jgi:hypothetical protein
MRPLIVLGMAASVVLAGCTQRFELVAPEMRSVTKGGIVVTPTRPWNRIPKTRSDSPHSEAWTENGPLLDSIAFIGGVPSGSSMAKQDKKDDRMVPAFDEHMSAQDLVSMIESYYRIVGGATVFEPISVKPAEFLSERGIQFDYRYVTGDGLNRRGRSLVAVVDGALYMMALQGSELHYFDAALPEFERMSVEARLSR